MSSVILNPQDCSFSLSIAASVKLVSLCVLVIRVFSFNALQCFKDDLVEKAEKLGNEGKVEEAQGVMKLCEQLRKERYHLENMKNYQSGACR